MSRAVDERRRRLSGHGEIEPGRYQEECEKQIKSFLAEGPETMFQSGAGVDLTRPDAINAALERFDRTVTELATLLEVEL